MKKIIKPLISMWERFSTFIAVHTIGITAEEWRKWKKNYQQHKQAGHKSKNAD